MTLILNGTDNSATTPAVTGTDTDTGVFFPAANVLAFATAGTEDGRFDANGNLLIATTSATPISGITASGQAVMAGARAFLGTSVGGDTVLGGTSGSNFTDLYVNGVSGARFNLSGSVVLKGGFVDANGTGITFPATQSASSNANTLDDYEEGNWTPTDASGAGLSLSVAGATYTKIGRTVYLQMYVTYPSTSNSNSASIGGLPFTSASTPSNAYGYLMGRTQNNTGNMITWQIGGGGSELICNYGWNSVAQPLNSTLSGAFILVSGTYITNT
jgi:hypothetical protein